MIARTVYLLLTMTLFGLVEVAGAQQVCYAYDSIGRLTGVVDQHNDAAFYDYDPAGNILAIRRKSPGAPVTIYSVDPPGGAPGASFEIFGVGFSAVASENQVTIGGVPAAIASTLPCTLVVTVPPDGISGPVRVVTPQGEATTEDPFFVSRFAIAGTAVAAVPSSTVQYTVVSNGCSEPAVTWRVNGVVGGNSVAGTISAAGLYTAPLTIPNPAFVTIRADSVACPTLFAEKTLNIVSELTAFVFATASVGRPSPSVTYPANVVVAHGSVANGPVISRVAPDTHARGGESFTLTITGVNLSGAIGVSFLGTATPDPAFTVAGVTVNADGTLLTASVSIAITATAGTRIVRIDQPGGHSTAANTGVNAFTVMP